MDEAFFIKKFAALEARVAALEFKRGGNGGALIVYDKEHDRVIEQMRLIVSTYGDHQQWSARDRERFNKLKVRRNELRKILGITV